MPVTIISEDILHSSIKGHPWVIDQGLRVKAQVDS